MRWVNHSVSHNFGPLLQFWMSLIHVHFDNEIKFAQICLFALPIWSGDSYLFPKQRTIVKTRTFQSLTVIPYIIGSDSQKTQNYARKVALSDSFCMPHPNNRDTIKFVSFKRNDSIYIQVEEQKYPSPPLCKILIFFLRNGYSMVSYFFTLLLLWS